MTLMSVDFPAPFSPSNPWTSPLWSPKETPFNAGTAPKDLVTDVSWSNGPVILTALAQQALLVLLDFIQPRRSHRNAFALAVKIPNRTKWQRFHLFLQGQARREITGGFGSAKFLRRLEQRNQKRPKHVARADHPRCNAIDARVEIIQTD